ncbi:MAG: bifunctional adenosylcobinamide kinase/adenosylcobinamide-phosphate guanylyltransferase [Rhodospirillales bacterium]
MPSAPPSSSAPLPGVTLVLGGARSGKSGYAEALIGERGPGLYLATAEAGDDEMAERIRLHRARRGTGWETVEEPLELPQVISRNARSQRPILVDCLTLWLGNLMDAGRNIEAATAALLDALNAAAGPIVFVSNEVGLGIVPATPLGRAFRDHAGRLNQAVAATADRVVFLAAGLPLILKDTARDHRP